MTPSARFFYRLYQWGVYVPVLLGITVIAGTLVILMAALPIRRYSYYVALAWARSICLGTPVRPRLKGKEKLQKGRSYVVVANHQSLFDIPTIYGWSGIDLKFVMKKELKRIPLFGQACAAKGHVFVDRSDRQSAIESLNRSVEDLHKGECVIIFPEGTRSRDGRVQAFRKGAFRLALQTGMPVLPISVAGTDRVQPSDTVDLFPGPIGLHIHEPIEVEGRSEEELQELMEKSRERIIDGKVSLEEDLGLTSYDRPVAE